MYIILSSNPTMIDWQRWSRGHKARGQGQEHKKNPRQRTVFLRTDLLEARDMNARGQGPRTQPQVLSKKRSSKKFFRRSPIHRPTQNFDWGRPKAQITCYNVIKNFQKRKFLRDKDIVRWKI